MGQLRTVTKLQFNALRYRLLKLTGRPCQLEAISLEITHRCICRCQMCNIWQIPSEVPDLPLSTWTTLLASPDLRGLRELDITGGEPFLRKDLPELLGWICQARAACFPKLKTVAITTNAILTDRILEVVGGIVGLLQKQGIDLVLACGMDAVGDKHDQIRNYKGGWAKFKTTLAGLKELRKSYPNLLLGIKTTIVPDNVHELDNIVSFARQHDLFTIISPCILTANRFGNLDLKGSLSFSEDDRQLIRKFYESPAFAWNGHRQSMLHLLDTGSAKKPCSAGFNTVFVRHTGEVFPCPLIPTALGNIKSFSLKQMLSSGPAAQFRKRIGSFPECKTCTEPGLERIAWAFEGATCLRWLFRLGYSDFVRLIRHMGLNKYF